MRNVFLLVTFCLLGSTACLLAQNVGIGTLTPNRAKLEVHGAAGSTNAIFGGDGAGISLQRNWPAVGFNQYYTSASKYIASGYAARILHDQQNGNLRFDMFTGGAKDADMGLPQAGLAMNTNGNVGIRADPILNVSLYVAKGANFDGSAIFGGTGYGSYFHYSAAEDTYIRGGKDGSYVFINNISGGKIQLGNGLSHVSINNGNPTYPLEIRQISGRGMQLVQPSNNSNRWELRLMYDSYYSYLSNLYMMYNGTYKSVMAGADGTIYYFSDRRLKTNIRDIPGVMQKFMQLEPVEYNMKAAPDAKNKTAGFIAQDVEKLFPQLVAKAINARHGYKDIDDLYGLNYDGFRLLSIRAMQEQQEKIKALLQQNEMLEKRISAAEAMAGAHK